MCAHGSVPASSEISIKPVCASATDVCCIVSPLTDEYFPARQYEHMDELAAPVDGNAMSHYTPYNILINGQGIEHAQSSWDEKLQ